MSSWSYHSWKLFWRCLRGSTTPEIISVEGNLEKKHVKTIQFKMSKHFQKHMKIPETKQTGKKRCLPSLGFSAAPLPPKHSKVIQAEFRKLFEGCGSTQPLQLPLVPLKKNTLAINHFKGPWLQTHLYKKLSIIVKLFCRYLTTQADSNFQMKIS